MDLSALDKALREIIERRNELQKLDYNNPKYDDIEEKLHHLEDEFQEQFGDYMEKIIKSVHDVHCPDTDVLYPIAYIAKAYTIDNNEYLVDSSDGVYVEIDKYPGVETKLAIVPNPVRIILNIGADRQEIVWKA